MKWNAEGEAESAPNSYRVKEAGYMESQHGQPGHFDRSLLLIQLSTHGAGCTRETCEKHV